MSYIIYLAVNHIRYVLLNMINTWEYSTLDNLNVQMMLMTVHEILKM